MKLKLLFLGLIFSISIQAQTPQTYVTFQGDTTELYKYEGEKTMLLAKSNTLDTAVMRKWTDVMDGAYNFYQLSTGREPEFLPNTYINNKSTIASADPTCGGGCGYLGATGIELLDAYFDQSYISILTENKYEQIYFYEMGRNFWFYGNKLSYENDPITTGYAVFMRFMAMKYLGVDDYPSHVDFVNQIRELRTTYLANPSLDWANTLGVAQGVPDSPWGGADLFASFCMYLEETYGWQWLENVWKYAELRPDRGTTQDAVDNFIIASSQASNTNLVTLFQEWRWPVSQSAIDYINSLDLGGPKFYLDYNGVTIRCMNCVPGDTGRVDGVLYEAVDRDLLIQRRDEGADLSKVCTSPVTDMTFMFGNATAFNQPIGSWDVSNVTNMEGMFYGASAFNQPIGSWDVSNITNMGLMFIEASSFNQPISTWDVSHVQKMDSMFMVASSFNHDINDWNVKNVNTMEAMFVSATSFNKDIGKWDVANVKNMATMFFDASSFNQAIGSWDVSNVINMTYMFYGATVFNQDLNNWCVFSISAEPDDFSTNSALTENNKPEWGTCPTTYIPDDNFEQALIDLGYDSAPLDDYVKTVKIKNVASLDVSNRNIEDLTGIEDFSNISNLKCYANKITSLDFSQNTSLTYLDCQENQLTSLDVSKNTKLTMLNCTQNQLTSLDVSKNIFLTNLLCSTNSLSGLDLSQNPNLYGLLCYRNGLTSLDISANTKLRELQCQINQLSSLDLSKNKYLNYLNCWDNNLSSLDVSVQNTFLVWLNCGSNSLTSIDISENDSLAHFSCENNQLTFESLEPAIDIETFYYSPQGRVGTTQFVSLAIGESFSYYLEVGGENNIYKWYKDSVLLPSQTSSTLSLTDLELDYTGVYSCEVTNSVVPGLTLYSRNIHIGETGSTYTYVPDDNFEQALIDLGYDSGELNDSVATAMIDEVTILDVSNKNIEDLTGIENFSSLLNLYCRGNKIVNLNVSHNRALILLDCALNPILNIDVSNNILLEYLDCSSNSLTNLDVTQNTKLTIFYCSGNKFGNLDVSHNINLRDLRCNSNNLTSIDLSQNKVLFFLNCWDTKLSTLDVSQNPSLVWLNCGFNSLTSIDVAQNISLEELHCTDNQLSNLDLGQNISLTYFSCQNNRLTFESLEPAIGIENFTYSPQDSVGTTQSVSKTKGESYNYYLEVGGENNIYKWYKDDVLLSNQTSATLELTNLELDDSGIYRCEVTNSILPELTLYSRKITLSVDNATYAGGNELIENFKVYPNPTSDKLYLETPTNGVVMLYDLNGKIVLNKNIENFKNEIDLSGFVSGTYLLQFDTNGSTKTFQIIKK